MIPSKSHYSAAAAIFYPNDGRDSVHQYFTRTADERAFIAFQAWLAERNARQKTPIRSAMESIKRYIQDDTALTACRNQGANRTETRIGFE